MDLQSRTGYSIVLKADTLLNKYPAKQHARAVAANLDAEDGFVYLPGAPIWNLEDSDQPRPFRQRRYFYYLSGVDEPDCHVVYDIKLDALTLFIPVYSAKDIVYNGRGFSRQDALNRYDVDYVRYVDDLESCLEFLTTEEETLLYVLREDQCPPGVDAGSRWVDTESLRPAMDRSRVIKDEHEIELIRKANDISAEAHRAVLRRLRSFTNEAQVAGIFLNTCVVAGARQSYEIIAASGANAATLHYVRNNQPFGDRWLMCLDAGAEWKCYASDVTRTFPLSGYWPSYEAKDIYDLVQEMQSACIKRIKPGVRFRDLDLLSHWILVKGLLRLGIFHRGSVEEIIRTGTSVAFCPHGLGHHVGLEVHDVGQKSLLSDTSFLSALSDTELAQFDDEYLHKLAEPLAIQRDNGSLYSAAHGLCEGMVVTVEPGVYFSKYALENIFLVSPVHSKFINVDVLERYMPVGGVRIEDDILVTYDGYENLTTAPKGEEALRIIRGCEEELETQASIRTCPVPDKSEQQREQASAWDIRSDLENAPLPSPTPRRGEETDPLPETTHRESLYQAMQMMTKDALDSRTAEAQSEACRGNSLETPLRLSLVEEAERHHQNGLPNMTHALGAITSCGDIKAANSRHSILAERSLPTKSAGNQDMFDGCSRPEQLVKFSDYPFPAGNAEMRTLNTAFPPLAATKSHPNIARSHTLPATSKHIPENTKRPYEIRRHNDFESHQQSRIVCQGGPDPPNTITSLPQTSNADSPAAAAVSRPMSYPCETGRSKKTKCTRHEEMPRRARTLRPYRPFLAWGCSYSDCDGRNIICHERCVKCKRPGVQCGPQDATFEHGLLKHSRSLQQLPTSTNSTSNPPSLAGGFRPSSLLRHQPSLPHIRSNLSLPARAIALCERLRPSPSAYGSAVQQPNSLGDQPRNAPEAPLKRPDVPAKPLEYRLAPRFSEPQEVLRTRSDRQSTCVAAGRQDQHCQRRPPTSHGRILSPLPGPSTDRPLSDPSTALDFPQHERVSATALSPMSLVTASSAIDRFSAALVSELTIDPNNRQILAKSDPIREILAQQPCFHSLCLALEACGIVVGDEFQLQSRVLQALSKAGNNLDGLAGLCRYVTSCGYLRDKCWPCIVAGL